MRDLWPAACRFQSAPRPRERGDSSIATPWTPQPCFNPRPALASGATPGHSRLNRSSTSFNPRPALASGATWQWNRRTSRTWCFNPRPALASGATRRRRMSQRTVCCFNPRPALASGATRGRLAGLDAEASFNPRPALASGATLRTGSRHPRTPVSIRAPPSRAGRHLRIKPPDLWSSRFNPRPALASGATSFPAAVWPVDDVSIRAPPSRAGRQMGINPLQRARMFQSAPRPRERGDADAPADHTVQHGFNPRPALASGATATDCREG